MCLQIAFIYRVGTDIKSLNRLCMWVCVCVAVIRAIIKNDAQGKKVVTKSNSR